MNNTQPNFPAGKTKFQQVLDVLKEKGYTEDQLAQFAADMTKAGFSKLYTEAMASFSDEDMAVIEACQDQEAANAEIRNRFIQRTGKNPDEEMQKFLDVFSDGFLAEYEKEKTQTSS